MTRTYTKEVTSTELVTGIIGTFDVASTIGTVVKYVEDVKRAEEQFKRLSNITEYIAKWALNEWISVALKSPDQIVELASPKLETAFNTINTELWNSLVNSAADMKITAGVYNQIAKALAQRLGLSTWYDILISQVQERVMRKVERHWNKVLGWASLSPEETLLLYRKGFISLEEHINNIREEKGYPLEEARKLAEAQFKGLSAYEAFLAFKRGLIDEDRMKRAFRAEGYKETDYELIYKFFHRIPSLTELTRIADYVELPSGYIEECLRAHGYSESDINYIKPAILRRPLREEVRSVTYILNNLYIMGYISREEYEAGLDSLGLLTTEKELQKRYSELRRTQYKIELAMDIVQQKVRKRIYTTIESITKALVDIGLAEDIANLYAEKWYYQYIYRPS